MVIRYLIPFSFSLLLVLASQVFAQEENISCVNCHKQLEGDLAKPVGLWQESIHKENGISCYNCHGGNPKVQDMDAMSPEAGFVGAPKENEIPKFCGKCHVAVMENYMNSPHWQTEKEKRPVCTTCHTAHHQQKATLDIINEKDCSKCHPYERAKKLKFVMEETEGNLVQLDGRIEKLREEGFDTQSLEAALFANRNEFHRLTHVLSVDLIVDKTGIIRGDTKKIEKSAENYEATIKRRRIGGAILVAFLFISAFIIHIYRKALS
ncbi:MAG: cytochrome c3 family protein [Ignavibacteriales bacterium]